jgi:hypothetical protein
VAERMLLMMNKNLPAFLWHMLMEQGLPKEFIKDLLSRTCEASMVAEMHKCKWDEKTRTLTTADEAKREKEVKAFESASWFKDEFGLLAKAAGKEKNYTAPEALYNLSGGAGSVKTIHDRHEKSKEDKEKGKETNKKKKEEVIELTSGESSSKSSSSESSSSSTSRDSASQPGRDSEESSSSDKRSRSKGRRGGKKSATGAARGG